jgi:superfamily II DNA or RNA helicase
MTLDRPPSRTLQAPARAPDGERTTIVFTRTGEVTRGVICVLSEPADIPEADTVILIFRTEAHCEANA